MKRSRLQIFLVVSLLALLGVLAALQYVWLGQISEAEKERLARRLQTDTERFSEDFNREIQSAYINFQADESLWRQKDWAQFNERLDFWRKKTAYPDLIREFYYFENSPESALLRYDWQGRDFTPAEWTDELRAIGAKAADERTFEQVDDERFALVMPIYEAEKNIERIFVAERRTAPPIDVLPARTRFNLPERKGFLVIRLDAEALKNQILAELARKHFPEDDFNLAVTGKNGQPIFQTREVTAAEATAKIFDLSPDNLIFFANRNSLPRTRMTEIPDVLLNKSVKTQTFSTVETQSITIGKTQEKKSIGTFQLKMRDGNAPPTVIQTRLPADGSWTLSVQHRAGSLDRFITSARYRNLGISFGILGLLAMSIVLIFVSAHRARVFAQRQIDFVSSVSHEFRTPLAVIYSAGENLADGVAREEAQVSRYGQLIKNEGRKLSAMVEQILAFAGANSGRKKYDFRAQDVVPIVEGALENCRSLIEDKGFAVETEIAECLPLVKADAAALSQAIQNLIGNSLKYSNGSKWLKIKAGSEKGGVRISVEDKGIGIAAQDLKHIFEPFYRAKTVVDEQIHGNGLGLSLVKETVRAHGGKVTVESDRGKGSKFIVHLPFID